MKFSLCLAALLATPVFSQDERCALSWKCGATSTAPTLDADHSEWADVEPYITKLVNTLGTEYDAGDVTYKCLYDTENIYFALEIPGEFGFSADSNELCASISTMFKVGASAEFVNMGNCPDAMGGCADGVPDTCNDYRVDIGAHWELKDTQQSTLYGLASNATTSRQASAMGDDEYAVSPFCRLDDDDVNAGNEWAGAWAHTNPVQGEFGTYHFEISRSLKTASDLTDVQLTPGETVQFGLAFWDPFQIEGSGWSDMGHYVTGCAQNWIDLELVGEGDTQIKDSTNQDGNGDAQQDGDDHDMGGTTTDAAAEASSAAALGVIFPAFLLALASMH